jgi:hypothetical protein
VAGADLLGPVDAYHEVEGGHVRIYQRRQLLGRLRAADVVPVGTHHAHALHSPYWWLKCLFGTDNERATLPRLYHRMLVYDIMRRPWWTRTAERLLKPAGGQELRRLPGETSGEAAGEGRMTTAQRDRSDDSRCREHHG